MLTQSQPKPYPSIESSPSGHRPFKYSLFSIAFTEAGERIPFEFFINVCANVHRFSALEYKPPAPIALRLSCGTASSQ